MVTGRTDTIKTIALLKLARIFKIDVMSKTGMLPFRLQWSANNSYIWFGTVLISKKIMILIIIIIIIGTRLRNKL